jgi:hypothetical protein
VLFVGAVLLISIGVAHSYLGERYILMRLFRRGNLPKLMGGTTFTQNTLRFAWHLTTVAWFGFAAMLFHIAAGPINAQAVGYIIGVTFLLHGACALVGSKGRHFSWPFFLIIGLASIIGVSG